MREDSVYIIDKGRSLLVCVCEWLRDIARELRFANSLKGYLWSDKNSALTKKSLSVSPSLSQWWQCRPLSLTFLSRLKERDTTAALIQRLFLLPLLTNVHIWVSAIALHTGNGTGSTHVCVCVLLVGHDDGNRLTITSVDALLLHVGLSLLHLVCLPQSSSIAAGDGDHQRWWWWWW